MVKSIIAALALAATFAAADVTEVKVCPVNEVFKVCGTACERTCFNVLQPKPVFCTFQCISECQCDTGYVRGTAKIDGKKAVCVLESECRPPSPEPKPPVATCEHLGKNYSVGQRFNDGCNDCECTTDGLASCTKRLCRPGSEPKPTVCERDGQVYKFGEEIKLDGCKMCSCLSDGSWGCHDRPCPPLPVGTCKSNGKTYLVGESYSDGCNNCVCVKDGTSACTKKLCTPPIETCEHLGETYSVGEKYKDDCNDCVCGKGGVATCTEKVCQACEHEYKLCQADWQCMVALWSPRATCTGRKKCQPTECAIDSSCEPFLCTSEEKCVSEPQHAPIGRCVILGDYAIIEGL